MPLESHHNKRLFSFIMLIIIMIATFVASKTECVENVSNQMMCYILIHMVYDYEKEAKLDK